MSKHLRALAIGAAIPMGLAAAPALYAQDYLSTSHGSMMGEGMMGSMMNMMGMSGDMGDMSGMMERCNEMMQAMDDHGAQRPNEQWQDRQPEQPRPEGDPG